MKLDTLVYHMSVCLVQLGTARHDIKDVPIHEIIFSSIDKPKLLSQVVGTRTTRYRAVPPKIDHRPISAVGGRLREKLTICGQLSEKKGRRRRRRGKEEKKKRGEEERIPSTRAQSSLARCRRPWVASDRAPSSLVRRRRLRVASACASLPRAVRKQIGMRTACYWGFNPVPSNTGLYRAAMFEISTVTARYKSAAAQLSEMFAVGEPRDGAADEENLVRRRLLRRGLLLFGGDEEKRKVSATSPHPRGEKKPR
ncbi:hypothetical protein GW17_00003197 [Ensete ventricosum]|nr:hypothetical protein GW17_00003197 [Ensete ventricosum]